MLDFDLTIRVGIFDEKGSLTKIISLDNPEVLVIFVTNGPIMLFITKDSSSLIYY